MDGIAVNESFRGQGIGKKLFAALEKFCKDNQKRSIRLDVIDENPRAKELYESLGFVSVRHEKIPSIIGNLIGVSGVTTMIKELEN